MWLLAYGIFYWASRLSLDSFPSVMLYLGYLSLLVLFSFLITGEILSSLPGFRLTRVQEPLASLHHTGPSVDCIAPSASIDTL
jgi:hypothetical protein